MTHEPMERDAALAKALADVVEDPMTGPAGWSDLRRATNARAAAELAKRRFRRRMRVALPASAAAGIALFVIVARAPDRTGAPSPSGEVAAGGSTIDELLDANVSDGEFRALVAGAADANELLLIAAEEGQ
jgi:hypothetical protein